MGVNCHMLKIKRMGASIALGLVLVGSLFSSGATAATISTQLATFDGQVNFNEVVLPENTPLTNQFQAQGVTFNGPYYDPRNGNGQPASNLIDGFSGASAGNFQRFGFSFFNHVTPFTFLFENTVDEFSMAGFSNGVLTIVDAYNNGSLVESASVNFGEFLFSNRSVAFGFTGILFDEIRIAPPAFAASLRFDDIRFNEATSVVPLPAALPLYGAGLAVMGFVGWRRRRKAAGVA